MNLKSLSTTALITRFHNIEAAVRWSLDCRRDASPLAAEWRLLRDELNSRPTDAVLEALRG